VFVEAKKIPMTFVTGIFQKTKSKFYLLAFFSLSSAITVSDTEPGHGM